MLQEAERARELQEQEARTQAVLNAEAVATKAKDAASRTMTAQDAGQQRIAQLIGAFTSIQGATGEPLPAWSCRCVPFKHLCAPMPLLRLWHSTSWECCWHAPQESLDCRLLSLICLPCRLGECLLS